MTGPTDLENGTPELGLEAAPELTAGRRKRDVVGWPAVTTAGLAHVLLLVWLIADWNGSAPPPAAPAPIPVALVMELPPPSPRPPAPPQPQQAFRQSGPDQQTTAAPEATQTAPTPEAPQPAVPAPKPEPAPAPEAKLAVEAPPPAAQPKPQQEPRRPKQEAQVPRAPKPAPPAANRALGEETKTGDPYLNRVWTLIQHNRPPTTPLGPAGLHLEGIAVFAVAVGRSGEVQGIRLVQSSGAPQLDSEAERMIVKAEPFPPLPPDYPDRVVIAVSLHLFPEMN